LLVAVGRRLSEGALGDEQEQALEDAFAGAAAAMLVEMARHTDLDRSLLGRLEKEFSAFFEDRQVAEMLLGAALGTRALSVEQLRRRYRDLSFDPGALPISFDRAIGLLTYELARRVRDNARSGGRSTDLW
jgi:hypothetical protein